MNRAGDFLCPLFTVRDRLLETEVTFGLHDDHYENSTWKNASVSLLNAPSQKLATQPKIKKHEINVPESLSNEAQEFDSELDRWFGGIVTLQHSYTRKL